VSEYIWEPFKNLSNIMEKVHEFHNDIQTNPCPFFVKLVIRKGSDVMDVMPWGSFFECSSMTFIEFLPNY